MALQDGSAAIVPPASDSFRCSICLELVFKPIVNACGHVFCFWCMHYAMDQSGLRHSVCPICRGAYSHFPRICETLHRFLCKAVPDEYKEREKEVRESENQESLFSPELPTSSTEPVSRKDLLCSRCDQLLFRPVALSCGHMFCQSCLFPWEADVTKCPTCAFAHRTQPLKVCLELDDYLKQAFPDEYTERTAALRSGTSSACTSLTSGTSGTGGSCAEPGNKHGHPLAGIHVNVGCDSCGVIPICGIRYSCDECMATNKMGYDLCEACYKDQNSNLTGRFNQQHTRDHTMRVRLPRLLNFGLLVDEGEEDAIFLPLP